MSFINKALDSIINIISPGNLLIIESTISLFTTDKVLKTIHSKRPDLKDNFYLAYCPERVLPGNTHHELVFNDRIIGGINKKSSKKAAAFYKNFIEGKIHKTDSLIAEMCKLTENSFRDSQIAFANEISVICDKANINVAEIVLQQHPRVNILSCSGVVLTHSGILFTSFLNQTNFIKAAREINLKKQVY